MSSIPPGAEIADGVGSKGKAPLRFPTRQGFTLTVELAGYQPQQLTIRAGQTGEVVARLVPLPALQRATRFSALDQLLREGTITVSEWDMRRRALAFDRNKELEAIQQRFERGEITRPERRRLVQEVRARYR